jgi:hypothetical protein
MKPPSMSQRSQQSKSLGVSSSLSLAHLPKARRKVSRAGATAFSPGFSPLNLIMNADFRLPALPVN